MTTDCDHNSMSQRCSNLFDRARLGTNNKWTGHLISAPPNYHSEVERLRGKYSGGVTLIRADTACDISDCAAAGQDARYCVNVDSEEIGFHCVTAQ